MNKPLKQHLIDPEICIRCYTCEMTCPIGAIEHDDNNVVVNAEICNFCMDCIPVCPTGSIDEWRVVREPYSLADQYEFTELPEQEELGADEANTSVEALDDAMAALLAGILHGMDKQCEPGEETSAGSDLRSTEVTLPQRWDSALELFRQADILPHYLGKKYCDYFAKVRQGECDDFHAQVSQLDYDWYLRAL